MFLCSVDGPVFMLRWNSVLVRICKKFCCDSSYIILMYLYYTCVTYLSDGRNHQMDTNSIGQILEMLQILWFTHTPFITSYCLTPRHNIYRIVVRYFTNFINLSINNSWTHQQGIILIWHWLAINNYVASWYVQAYIITLSIIGIRQH